MKSIKILVLAVLAIAIFQGILYSGINSRVEGTVADDQTGIPLEGVLVRLIIGSSVVPHTRLFDWETKTDKNGFFKFDLEPIYLRGYVALYLECEKKGYIPFLPKYYRQYIKKEMYDEVFKVFRLKEGRIKHIKLRLQKGGIIEGTLYKKTTTGISPLKTGGILFCRYKLHSFFLDKSEFYLSKNFKTDENGKFLIEGIEPFDKYSLSIHTNGYRYFRIENISVQSGQVTPLEYTCNMMDQTGVTGVVSIKAGTLWGGSVSVTSILKDTEGKFCSCTSHFRKDGRYSCLGIVPGIYSMLVYASTEDNKSYEKEIQIEIVAGVTKNLDINF